MPQKKGFSIFKPREKDDERPEMRSDAVNLLQKAKDKKISMSLLEEMRKKQMEIETPGQ